uniref:Lipocalin n=1 Tax=Rhipicephalus zambeziensis TaxID=60191 RepID=A0A224YA73_9ACAR
MRITGSVSYVSLLAFFTVSSGKDNSVSAVEELSSPPHNRNMHGVKDNTTTRRRPRARKILKFPHNYWLLQRSDQADTSFTSGNSCVQLDYISVERGKGLAILSVLPEGTADWVEKLYDVSVSSTAPNILQYTEFDATENGCCASQHSLTPCSWQQYNASAPVDYQVLFLAVNSCYIVEKTNRTTPPSVVNRSEKTRSRDCQVWVTRKKETGSDGRSVNKQAEEKCQQKSKQICGNLESVYRASCELDSVGSHHENDTSR